MPAFSFVFDYGPWGRIGPLRHAFCGFGTPHPTLRVGLISVTPTAYFGTRIRFLIGCGIDQAGFKRLLTRAGRLIGHGAHSLPVVFLPGCSNGKPVRGLIRTGFAQRL